ncbi:hypothetical protein F4818DRAFT_279694 [Hypoxylon cercidicola]|nr:hypothetical protein F4818DRAFT_279694 [Hypoxylon cercidicola]
MLMTLLPRLWVVLLPRCAVCSVIYHKHQGLFHRHSSPDFMSDEMAQFPRTWPELPSVSSYHAPMRANADRNGYLTAEFFTFWRDPIRSGSLSMHVRKSPHPLLRGCRHILPIVLCIWSLTCAAFYNYPV